MKVQKLNKRQAHWVLCLLRFDFTLKYIPGIKIRKANELSKRLDWKIGIENNNNNQKINKREVGTRNDRSSSKRTRNDVDRKNKKDKRKR